MRLTEALWHEDFHGTAEYLLPRVTEHSLRLRVDQHDFAALIDDDHGVRRRLHESTKHPLHAFPFGDVMHECVELQSWSYAGGPNAQLDRKLVPVPVQGGQLHPLIQNMTAPLGEVAGHAQTM